MPLLHNASSFSASKQRGGGLLNFANILSGSTTSFSEFTAIENALPSSGYKFSCHLGEIYCFSTQASSISRQAVGQMQKNHFILLFHKFQILNLPAEIGNSALREFGKESKWNKRWPFTRKHLEPAAKMWLLYLLSRNLWIRLLATPTSIPTETALLLSLKAVPGLDNTSSVSILGNLWMAWQFLVLKKL